MIFSGGILYQLLIIYTYELFPAQVTALGMGLGQVAVCSVNIVMPSVFLLMNAVNFPKMALFCLVTLVFVVALVPLPKTLGAEPADIIEEISPFGDSDEN